MFNLLSQGVGFPASGRTALIAAVIMGIALVFFLTKRARNIKETPKTAPVGAPASTAASEHRGIQIGNAQHIGSRTDQQDSFGISDIKKISNTGLLAVIGDGMGGLSNGAAYSKTAIQAALKSFGDEKPEEKDEATLLRVLKRAREAIEASNLKDGGTTFIAALIHDRQLHFVSVGDSRICLMRNGGLIQLNREHVYGRELDDLAARGLLNEEDALNDQQRAAITSYLGMPDRLEVDRNINAIPLFSGDKIVLMTDGIYNRIAEEALTELLRQAPMAAAEAIQNKILEENNPDQDNLTIIILEVE